MTIVRKGRKYSVPKVLDKVLLHCKRKNLVNFGGDMINLSSKRYLVFKLKGTICCECGLKGEYFVKEKHSDTSEKFHLALYGVDKDGIEVEMTKDHSIPSARGGHDTMDNLNPMCARCNTKKGNSMPDKEKE